MGQPLNQQCSQLLMPAAGCDRTLIAAGGYCLPGSPSFMYLASTTTLATVNAKKMPIAHHTFEIDPGIRLYCVAT